MLKEQVLCTRLWEAMDSRRTRVILLYVGDKLSLSEGCVLAHAAPV
jgi:hypothetical protein